MAERSAGTIEIQVEEIAQLFDMLDPYPFRERDLDKNAEEYIVSWAREFPRQAPLRIRIHLPRSEAEKPAARDVSQALARYFAYRAEAETRELKELFRIGRRSLAIGMAVLAACVTAGRLVVQSVGTTQLSLVLSESLLLLGWVSNWRPIEIFLHGWWPIARKRDLYRRLAAATIELAPR
ncbi:MAG: hypothetical protein ACT4OG_09735 [Alphaproteobacteria bacterium]